VADESLDLAEIAVGEIQDRDMKPLRVRVRAASERALGVVPLLGWELRAEPLSHPAADHGHSVGR
jgi:hypothetical protein